MNIHLDCIPCFLRQALEAARRATSDPAEHEQMLRDVLAMTSEMNLSESPPMVGQRIHRRLRALTASDDPYAEIKAKFNQVALDLRPEMAARVAAHADPLAAAVQLAIAGNLIDLGPNGKITEEDARRDMLRLSEEPIQGDLEEFRRAVADARSILYLTDNVGEIVFDQPLVAMLPPDRVTVAVRGRPVINDATLEDAETAGLTELVEVVDNGADAQGPELADCSEDFRARFRAADCIIAKGQGNFETLSEEPANIFFLFKAKCPVIATHAGVPLGAHVLLRSRAATATPGPAQPVSA